MQIVRIQKITCQLNLNFNADGQLSDKNLDGSQKLSLGGSSGVRAYPSGEASGDAGYKYSIDAKYNIDQNYLNTFSNLSASVFYDYGMIRQYYNTSNVTMTTPNHYSLSGYGVGFGGTAYKVLDLKLMYAHTLGSNQGATSGKNSDGTADQYRLLLLVNTSF